MGFPIVLLSGRSNLAGQSFKVLLSEPHRWASNQKKKIINPYTTSGFIECGSGSNISSESGSIPYPILIQGFVQCCGSGSGIRCLLDPWIRDGKNSDLGSGMEKVRSRIRKNTPVRNTGSLAKNRRKKLQM
jgi:hypothetical protein